MITYSQLGKNGRLGNQMFQYATLFSAGFTRGYQIGIPKDQKINQVFSIDSAEKLDVVSCNSVYKEKDFSFDPNIFLIPDGTDLYGYFQSGNYFNHCEEALRKEFQFSQEIVQRANDIIAKYENIPLCSIHVRRGDYTNLSHYHTNLGSNYYIPACKLVHENIPNVKFLVFSDDVEWCKNAFKDEKFIVVDTKDDALDLCIMSQCPVHVIANSSFSWWGAWLSRSTAVVAPKQWFGKNGPQNWQSVYQHGWILL